MIDVEARQTRAWAMLTARAQSYEWVPSSHGGMSQAQVAAALSGLEDPHLSAGLLCKAGIFSKRYRVAEDLHRWTIGMATIERWDLPQGPGPLARLVVLAILEETGPSVVCTWCDGSGINPHPWKAAERRSCKFCEGRGRLPRLEKPRWALIEISEANWSRTWRNRYAAVLGALTGWVQVADEHLRKGLQWGRTKAASFPG